MNIFPFLIWWPRVNRLTFKSDLIAGLTGGLILVPQGVAFATIAGLPPEYGLYCAMLPAIVAALWGSSWQLVSGPTTAISIVVFATMSPLATPGSPQYVSLVLTLTFLIGVFQLALGALRLGTLVNLVSHTVVVGFTAGAAILIATSQVKNFFGLPMIARGATVREVLFGFAQNFSSVNQYVFAVAMVTVVTSLIVKRYLPRIPHMIAAMLVGSGAALLLNASFGGAEQTGIASIGALKIGLPPFSSPDFSLDTIEKLLPIAIAVAVLALTEAVSIARSVALKTGQRIDGSQEFIGQGLSNIVGAFFSGYASSGSFNRSGLNYESGAKTPLAAVFSAIFLLLIVLFLAPLAKYLPIAAMAGILFVVAWGLIDLKQIKGILQTSRAESAVLICTFIATLSINLEYAIFIGVILSLMLYLNRTSRPPLVEVVPKRHGSNLVFETGSDLVTYPTLKIVRLNGSIFFGAVNHLQEELQALSDEFPQQTHLLLVASGINFIDMAGAHLVGHEALRRRASGGDLYIYDLKDEPMQMMQRTGQIDVLGQSNLFAAGEDVIAKCLQLSQPAVSKETTSA